MTVLFRTQNADSRVCRAVVTNWTFLSLAVKTQQSESIAAVYRFKHATAPASDGRSEDVKYVYLNCRAYLALNPGTFLLDQIACLAAAETLVLIEL